MIYATQDSNDGSITENADISKFATRAEAEAFLIQGLDLEEWEISFEFGRFSDCWIKSHSAPKVGDHWLSPFSRAAVNVAKPGQHPGGKRYWITPQADILVAVLRPIYG